MTEPVCRQGDGIFLLTNTCVSGFYLLNPCEEVNKLFEYVVSRAGALHNVAVYAKSMMSNHIHIVAGERDLTSDISAFKQSVSANLTMGINKKYNRRGSIWSAGQFHEEQLHSIEAVENAIVYTITNPVAAGLVAKPELWPGVVTKTCQLGTKVKTCLRPKLFGEKSTQPLTADLVLEIPKEFREKSKGEFQRHIANLVDLKIASIKEERRGKGLKGFLGVKAIRKQTIDQRPKDYDSAERFAEKSQAKLRARQFSCPNRDAWLVAYKSFLEDYYTAFEKWRTDKTACFPLGTYKMRKVHKVQIN